MNHDWDELASAYLDGEATEEEVALVESTPAAMDIVAEFRIVAAANAVVPPSDPELERAQIASALSLFDDLAFPDDETAAANETVPAEGTAAVESAAGTDAVAPPATTRAPTDHAHNVTDIATRRNRRNRWLATAAAGVVAVAGIGIGIASSPLGGGDDSATDSAEVAASPSAADSDTSADDQARASALAESAPTDDGAMELDEGGAGGGQETGETAATAEADTADAADDTAEEQADEETESDSAEAETTTTQIPATPPPLVELTTGQDLFTVVDMLDAQGFVDDAELDFSERLSVLAERCPTDLAELVDPVAIPVRYDGQAADLVLDRTGPERVLVLTSTCSVLAADERP